MTYDQALSVFQQANPNVDLSSQEGRDAFNAWSGSLGPGGFEAALAPGEVDIFADHPNIAAAYAQAAQASGGKLTRAEFAEQWANENPNDPILDDPKILTKFGLEPDTSNNVPVEDAWGRYAIDQGNKLIAGDAQRKIDANSLLKRYDSLFDSTRSTIADLAQTVNSRKYFAENPDVAAAYEAAKAGDPTLTPEKFAEQHWRQYGQYEGRASPMQASAALQSELAASALAEKQQLDALATQIQSMQSSLSEEVRAKATALAAQLQQLTQGLGTFTAAERASLTQQLATQVQALNTETASRNAALDQELATRGGAITNFIEQLKGNLSGELATRATAIQQQIQALTQGLGQYTAAERASLQQQFDRDFASLETELGARKTALEQQVAALGSAVSANDVALRNALATELQKLTAAQAPLNQARINAAQTTATAVNLAAQAEQDRVRATMAEQGYVGSSTGTDMALARAAIAGRQGAADALGQAQVANAADDAQIARYGAGKEAGIAERTAGANLDLASFGANESRSLADYGATGRRAIENTNSVGIRDIDRTANQGALGIANFGATENRALTDYGATTLRGIGDTGATRQLNLADYGAGSRREIADTGASELRGITNAGALANREIDLTFNKGNLGISNFGATEGRALADYSASGTKGIADYSAGETRNIKDSAAGRGLAFFSNDLQRRLAALSLPEAAVSSEFNIRQMADDYGNSGLRSAMTLMSPFRTNAGAAPNAVPFTGYRPTDNGLDNVGAAMVSIGGNIAKANNWWSPPTVRTGNGGTSSFDYQTGTPNP